MEGSANVSAKSVYESADPGDGYRVLATRYWPRGIARSAADEYISRLAPSRELLQAFRRGAIDWETFRTHYLKEMENEGAQEEIRRLATMARSQRVTVMCVCRDEGRCHRSLLRDLIVAASSP